MPAPTTIDEFLALARKSNQVDSDRLDAYLSANRDAALPSEPKKLAQKLIRDGLMTVFQAEQFLQGKYKGFMLGGYRIVERLGQGGTGTVYLAEHDIMKRLVAVKVLPTPLAEDRELLERFRLEARAVAVLDHPNVVHVYDFRQEGQLNFIVLEYIDGPNLQQIIDRRGPMSIPLACEYVRQAALGLHHAHEVGLIHRDVKPANLLVDPSGLVKVLDLGLAKYEAGSEGVTERFNSKMVLGTADYLAPEQALNLHNVDARTDIYSLGATLYALLAGRPPFHEASVGQKLMWHQMKEPDPVSKHRPETPPGLVDLVTKMLAKKPDDRPTSAAEVAQALTEWARLEPRPEARTALSGVALLKSGRTTSMGGTGVPSGRLPSRTPPPDTWSHAKDDTGSIDLDERSRRRSSVVGPLPDLTLNHEGAWLRLGLLIGLVALVAGISGGVVAFLLWGPYVG